MRCSKDLSGYRKDHNPEKMFLYKCNYIGRRGPCKQRVKNINDKCFRHKENICKKNKIKNVLIKYNHQYIIKFDIILNKFVYNIIKKLQQKIYIKCTSFSNIKI